MKELNNDQPKNINSTAHEAANISNSTAFVERMAIPAWVYVGITLTSILLGVITVVRGSSQINIISSSDLTNFLLKSAEYIVKGDPWQIYSVRASAPLVNVPNDDPPVSMWLMAPLLGLAHELGFTGFRQEAVFVSLPFVILPAVLGAIVLRVLKVAKPDLPQLYRLLAFMLITLSPLTWTPYSPWGHLEIVVMVCFLCACGLALYTGHEVLAGVFAWLSVYTAITAFFPLLAIGVLLLAHKNWRSAIKVGGIGGALLVVTMAPYFIFDRQDAFWSLVDWRPKSEITGSSVWSIFALNGANLPFSPHVDSTLAAVARRLDTPLELLLIVAAAVVAARLFKVSAYSPHVWGLMAVGALALPMLTKRNWPYYLFEPFVLLIVWEFATLDDDRESVWRWPVISIGYLLIASVISGYMGLKSVGYADRLITGVGISALMLGVIVLLWKRLRDVTATA